MDDNWEIWDHGTSEASPGDPHVTAHVWWRRIERIAGIVFAQRNARAIRVEGGGGALPAASQAA